MQLTLEPQEQEILLWALKSTLSELGAEIAGTENQEVRDDLKERKRTLVAIINRLG
jgi:hypothetical protein